VSSESSCAVRLARHSQNAWARHVECVESSRVESSQVEFELNRTRRIRPVAYTTLVFEHAVAVHRMKRDTNIVCRLI